ncbi:MAG TPA: hypothetical protein PK954_01850 [Anaerolineales bacterium]|nr:hypothetical protein [Anaerolineales bacterium]
MALLQAPDFAQPGRVGEPPMDLIAMKRPLAQEAEERQFYS